MPRAALARRPLREGRLDPLAPASRMRSSACQYSKCRATWPHRGRQVSLGVSTLACRSRLATMSSLLRVLSGRQMQPVPVRLDFLRPSETSPQCDGHHKVTSRLRSAANQVSTGRVATSELHGSPTRQRKLGREIGRKLVRTPLNDEGHLAVAFALSRPVCRAFASPTPWSASIAGAGFEPATFGL